MPEISIIVPVYNVEKYLNRCIDSILNQTFSDFELILVDDGSLDRCGEICDEYASKDSRIRVIHKENGGVSSARNIGIKLMKGKYVQFIDSDDWVDKSFLATSLDKIIKDNSDMVFWAINIEDEEGYIVKRKNLDKNEIEHLNNDLKEDAVTLYRRDLFGYTWSKLFKASIIAGNSMFFDEEINFCEDEEFTCRYYMHARRISFLSQCKYHYITYESQQRITLSQNNNKNEILIRDKVFLAWCNLLGTNNKNYLINKAYNNIKFLFFDIVWSNTNNAKKKKDTQKLKGTHLFKFIRSYGKDIHLKILILFIGFNLIKLFRIYNRVCLKFNIQYGGFTNGGKYSL